MLTAIGVVDEAQVAANAAKAALAAQHQEEQGQDRHVEKKKTVVRRVSPELYIVAAETAVKLSRFQWAASCLELYYEGDPPSDQFMCRARFCGARIEASRCADLIGDKFSAQVLHAVSFVMAALDVAEADLSRYSFLVHNASITYAEVARPLLRAGRRTLLLPSLERLVAVMERAREQESRWRVLYMIQLACCYDDLDKGELASKTMQTAKDLLKSAQEPLKANIHERVLRHQVHVNRKGKGLEQIAKDVEAEAKKDEVVPGSMAIFLLQKIKSGVVEPAQVAATLGQALEALGNPLPTEEEAADPNSTKKFAGAAGMPRDPESLARLGVVAEAGRIALQYDLHSIARHCVERTLWCKAIGLHRAWVLSELTSMQLAVQDGEATAPHDPRFGSSADKLKIRLRVVSELEKTLTSAMRLPSNHSGGALAVDGGTSADVVQETCVLMWNLALPLLQPAFRPRIQRALKTCCSALHAIQSPLTLLRVQFHLEMAKCEVDSEFLEKASQQVKAALALDYSLSPTEIQVNAGEELKELLRPLDRPLLALKESLHVRLNPHLTGTTEDEALLLLDQAKSARVQHTQRSLLARAVVALQAGEPNAAALQENPELARRRATLWNSIAREAWARRFLQLALQASEASVSREWDPATDKDMVVEQAHAWFIKCHACAAELERLEHLPGEADAPEAEDDQNVDSDGEQIEESMMANSKDGGRAHQLALQWQGRLEDCLHSALEIGARLNEEWIVLNACTLAWNTHRQWLALQSTRRCGPGLVKLLQACHTALCKNSPPDIGLISCISTALARELAADPDTFSQCADVCLEALAMLPPLEAGGLLKIYARLSNGEVTPWTMPAGRELSALVMLEQLSLDQTPNKPELLEKLLATLSSPASALTGGSSGGPGHPGSRSASRSGGKSRAEQRSKSRAGKDKDKGGGDAADDAPIVAPDLSKAAISSAQELESELWTRAAQAALAQGLLSKALSTANQATLPLRPNLVERPSSRSLMSARQTNSSLGALFKEVSLSGASPRRLRWYSIAESVHGQGLQADIEKYDSEAQDAIIVAAAEHFCLSAKYARASLDNHAFQGLEKSAAGVKRPFDMGSTVKLVLRAAQMFWNCVLPLSHGVLTRKQIKVPIGIVVECVQAALRHSALGPGGLQPHFRAQLYCLHLDCVMEADEWEAALNAAYKFLPELPRSQQEDVQTRRILCQSRLDRGPVLAASVVSSAVPGRGQEARLRQARVWSELARASPNAHVQLLYRQRAISCITAPLDQVPYLIEMGEWLLLSGEGTRQDAEDQLLLAVDILHDREPELDSDSASPHSVSHHTHHSGGAEDASVLESGRGSISDHSNQLTGRDTNGQLDSQNNSRKPSVAPSVPVSRQLSRAGSRAMSQAPSLFAPSVTGSKGPRLSVAQLGTLVHVYAMLSTIAHSTQQRTGLALVVCHYVLRMWRTAVDSINSTIALRAKREKQKALEALMSEKERAQARRERQREKLLKARAKKRGQVNLLGEEQEEMHGVLAELGVLEPMSLPTTAPGWLSFSPTASMREVFKRDNTKTGFTINSRTVRQPAVLVCYLDAVVGTLEQAGYTLQCFPLHALVSLLAEDVLDSRALLSLTTVRASVQLHELGLPELANERLANGPSLVPSQVELTQMKGEARRMQQQTGTQSGPAFSSSLTQTVSTSSEAGREDAFNGGMVSVKVVRGVDVAEVMARTAQLAIRLGQVEKARVLVGHARENSVATKEREITSLCDSILATVAELEGNHKEALRRLYAAQRHRAGVDFWTASVISLLGRLSKAARQDDSLAQAQARKQQIGVLRHGLATMMRVAAKQSEDSLQLDAVVACTRIRSRLAALLVEPDSTNEQPAPKALQEACGLYAHAASTLRSMAEPLGFSRVLLDYAKTKTLQWRLARSNKEAELYTAESVFQPPETEHVPHAVVEAMQALLEAEHVCSEHRIHTRPAMLPAEISLPACRALALIKLELSRLHLELAAHLHPARRYQIEAPRVAEEAAADSRSRRAEGDEAPQGDENTAEHEQEGADAEPALEEDDEEGDQLMSLVGHNTRSNARPTTADTRPTTAGLVGDDRVREMFFIKYTDVFGEPEFFDKAGHLELALSYATAALSVAPVNLCGEVQAQIGACLVAVGRRQHAQWEDDQFRQRLLAGDQDPDLQQAEGLDSSATSVQQLDNQSTMSELGNIPNLRDDPATSQVLDLSVTFAQDSGPWSPLRLAPYIIAKMPQNIKRAAQRVKAEAAGGKAKAGAPPAAGGAAAPGGSGGGKRSSLNLGQQQLLLQQQDALAPTVPLPVPVDYAGRWRSRAVQTLAEAMRASWLQGAWPSVGKVALAMVDAYCTFRPELATKFLAIHVSCLAHQRGKDVFLAAAPPTNAERLIWERVAHLEKNECSYTPDAEKARQFRTQHSLAYARLSLDFSDNDERPAAASSASQQDEQVDTELPCDRDYAKMLAELGDNKVVLTLLVDKGHRCIYASILGASVPARANRQELSPEDEEALASLSSQAVQLHQSVHKQVLRHQAKAESTELDAVEARFAEHVAATEAALAPVLDRLFVDQATLQNRDVVLVTGPELFSLPLEGLQCLAAAKSVSRDFSLHLHYRRTVAQANKALSNVGSTFVIDPHNEAKGAASASSAGSSSGGGGSAGGHSHSGKDGSHGSKDKDKDKDDKAGAAARQDINSVSAILSTVAQASSWKGVSGEERRPQQGEMQRLLCSATAFIYVGFEGLALLPESVAGLDCTSVGLVHCADRLTNETSYRRQSALENHKSEKQRALETPFSTALLLTVRGVNSIVQNRYAISPDLNLVQCNKMWQALGKGQSIGEAVQAWRQDAREQTASLSSLLGKAAAAKAQAKTLTPPTAQMREQDRWNTVLVGLPGLATR